MEKLSETLYVPRSDMTTPETYHPRYNNHEAAQCIEKVNTASVLLCRASWSDSNKNSLSSTYLCVIIELEIHKFNFWKIHFFEKLSFYPVKLKILEIFTSIVTTKKIQLALLRLQTTQLQSQVWS